MKLFAFLSQRLLIAIVSMFLVASATFFLMKAVPGDPFLDDQGMTNEVHTMLRRQYGLDDPLLTQYFRFLAATTSFDFGISLKYPSQRVADIICQGFPISASIGLAALAIALPLGAILGSLSAFKQHGTGHFAASLAVILGVSLPSFVIAAMLQFAFAIYFPLFPVARWGSCAHMVLPALALAVGPACYITRLLRASIADIASSPYVYIAKSKGLHPVRILAHHILHNAFLPLFGYLGPMITNILVGSFVVERVFGIPGLGQWFINSVMNRDYPLIMGLTLFYSLLLIVNHALIEVAVTLLYPRQRAVVACKI